jgi:hypothetical protein
VLLQVRVKDSEEMRSHSHPPSSECSKRAWYRPYSSTLCKIASKVNDWPIAEVVHMCLDKVRASGAVQYIEISVHWTEPTCTTHDRQVKWTSAVFIPDGDGNSRPTPSFTTRFQSGMRQASFIQQCKVTDLIRQSRLLGCILS